jgi:hypothetical protein
MKILWLLFIFVCISFLVYKEPMSVFNSSLTFSLPTKIDRYDCSDATHQYCYNGDLIKTDIFGNNVALEGEEYLHGTTYTHQERPRVYIKDFNTTVPKGSSKTRDVFYDPYKTCNHNYPWRLDLSSNTISNHACTSTKDIENYNTCVSYEKQCPFKDILMEDTLQYVAYDCSDGINVKNALTDVDAEWVTNTMEIGTYKDTSNRALNVYKGRQNTKGENYDSEKCSEACTGYNYYALQHGNRGNPQCFCGNSLDQATQYGPKTCPKTGGSWCNSIYKNVCGFKTVDSQEYSNSCYKEKDMWVVNNMTPVEEKCKQTCSTSYYTTPKGDVSNCFLYEAQASYEYDFYKGTSNTPPTNPLFSAYKDVSKREELEENDIVKIRNSPVTYSVPLCSEENPFYANGECRPKDTKEIDTYCNETTPYRVNGLCVDGNTALEAIENGCNQKKPYRKNNICYASPEDSASEQYTFSHSSGENCYVKEVDYGISCENMYSIQSDISMLYNPITNNYIGDLHTGDYSYIDCTGTLTKCMNEFPYVKNEKNEYVLPMKTYASVDKNIPVYTRAPDYIEPAFTKYTNPYNSDIQHSLFIQCKHNYSKRSPKINMCPEQMPICEGYETDQQFGLCKETKHAPQSVVASSRHFLACKHNYDANKASPNMCPYTLPYCEQNECKQSSLYNLITI